MSGTVIVGAGQAALSCAAKLRDLGYGAPITMLGEEPHPPYQRPPLSKKYATGEMEKARLYLRNDDWYGQADVDLRTGTPVTAIDRDAKTVMTPNGAVSYDHLVLATGARPRMLPAEIGGALPGVHVLRTLADADALAAEFGEGRKAVVIGGGYIGLEAAAVLATRGMTVTVIEAAPRILQRVASAATADYFRALHERHGVTVLEDTALARIEGERAVTGIALADGRTLPADFVLVGIGILPNDTLAAEAGLACDAGIEVDERGRTADPAIFACGDCARLPFRGRLLRLESVQNAIDQAEAVAAEIAGQGADYDPVPWFWSDQYDVKLQIAGLNLGHDSTITRPGKREGSQSVWYFANGDFLAVDAMNDPQGYLIGKRLLEAGKGITPEQAADPATDLKALLTG